MAWEKRKPDGSAYYYLSRRDHTGRVRKVYLGIGSAAHERATLIARGKAERATAGQKVEAVRAQLLVADGLMGDLEEMGVVLFEAFLLSQGCHRPNYGKWRRRRGHGRHQSTDPGTDC
jgi:hypothetical protein